MKGSHEIKFGGEILRSTNDIKNDFRTMGLFNFNGNITGNAFADFMLGEVYQFDQGGGEYKELYGTRWGFFGQDTWRATSNLTLTLGLRWDPMFPFHDDLGPHAVLRAGRAVHALPESARRLPERRRPRLPDGRLQLLLAPDRPAVRRRVARPRAGSPSCGAASACSGIRSSPCSTTDL